MTERLIVLMGTETHTEAHESRSIQGLRTEIVHSPADSASKPPDEGR